MSTDSLNVINRSVLNNVLRSRDANGHRLLNSCINVPTRKPFASRSIKASKYPISSAATHEIEVEDDAVKPQVQELLLAVSAEDSAAALQLVVKFKLPRKCEYKQSFWVCGSVESLGSWNVDRAIPLTWTEGDVWIGEAVLPANVTVEFKYVLKGARGELTWQPGRNRIIHTENIEHGIIVVQKPWIEGEFTTVIEVEEAEEGQQDSAGLAVDGNLILEATNGSLLADDSSEAVEEPAEIVEAETRANSVESIAEESIEGSSLPAALQNPAEGQGATKKTPSPSKQRELSVLDKDLQWSREVWVNLLKSWGRIPLMDEENHKSSS